ncbi:MAG: hypothetical protein KGI50_05080 [Patescibacteria group bacterium]|nr:hypothetical protein [Patescibacteria group bacterium]MDE2438692.1 hypothetical protein [Patescibacteria group bacterium]
MSEENNEVKSEQSEEQKPESQEGVTDTQAEENSAGKAEGQTDAGTAAPEQENSNA